MDVTEELLVLWSNDTVSKTEKDENCHQQF